MQRNKNQPSALRDAPRCGAKTRSGSPCQSPRVTGKARCRMHGGAAGSGAPKGKANGNWKHGRYGSDLRGARRLLRALALSMRKLPE
jgi:hypothetical protein